MQYISMISFMCGAMFGIGVVEECNPLKVLALVFYIGLNALFYKLFRD